MTLFINWTRRRQTFSHLLKTNVRSLNIITSPSNTTTTRSSTTTIIFTSTSSFINQKSYYSTMSKLQVVGALDQGTTSTRFMLFDVNTLRQVAVHQLDHKQYYPHPGWVEHDPLEILDNSRTCISRALGDMGDEEFELKGIGITNQRETTIVWDSTTGKPLYNAIVWNDARTDELVKQILLENATDSSTDINSHNARYFLQRLCGLPVTTYFSALKLRWLVENVEEVKKAVEEKRCMFGTIDSWLIWNMTGGVNGGKHVTDVTNASRTMLMNIEKLAWDNELKTVFKIPDGVILPEIRSSAELFGDVPLTFKNQDHQVPISGCVGDQQSALIGQRCFSSGDAKNTYGTGCFVLLNTGNEPIYSTHGLLTTVGYKLGKDQEQVYALEGSVAVAGSGVKWLKDNMNIISSLEESEQLAKSVNNTGGIYFVPAFSGLFAPYWRSDARGIIVGMTNYTTRAHICRAMLEAVSHQTQEVLEAMHKDAPNASLSQLKVDGGMSNNTVVMQSQANLLGVPVIRPKYIETTAVGAAICAGIGSGVYKSLDDVPSLQKDETTVFTSQISDVEREKELKRWDMAVARTLNSIDFLNVDEEY